MPKEVHYAALISPKIPMTTDRYKAALRHISSEGYVLRELEEGVFERIREMLSGSDEIHLQQFTCGVMMVLMSTCSAAWFPKEWETDPLLKDLHLLAFKYGMTILVEK